MAQPQWVTVTFALPEAFTDKVDSRQLRIYSTPERDADATVAPLVSATLANSARTYDYDMKLIDGANAMFDVELWDVDEDGRAGQKRSQRFAINASHPLYNKLPAPGLISILMIDEASSESSESDESSQS